MPYIIRAMIGRRMNKQGIIRPSTRVGHTARLPMMMAVVLRKVLSLFFMARMFDYACKGRASF